MDRNQLQCLTEDRSFRGTGILRMKAADDAMNHVADLIEERDLPNRTSETLKNAGEEAKKGAIYVGNKTGEVLIFAGEQTRNGARQASEVLKEACVGFTEHAREKLAEIMPECFRVEPLDTDFETNEGLSDGSTFYPREKFDENLLVQIAARRLNLFSNHCIHLTPTCTARVKTIISRHSIQ